MPFVNEYIPEEDFEKYQLREIDKHHVVGGVNAHDWTIDRERDMYLRQLAQGREEFSHEMYWTFYWHSRAYTLELHAAGYTKTSAKAGRARWGLVRINGKEPPAGIPEPSDEFLNDLREALLAYKDGGVFSNCTQFEVELVPGLERR
jgi:hypothetical protein